MCPGFLNPLTVGLLQNQTWECRGWDPFKKTRLSLEQITRANNLTYGPNGVTLPQFASDLVKLIHGKND
jgi:hypothetical protein